MADVGSERDGAVGLIAFDGATVAVGPGLAFAATFVDEQRRETETVGPRSAKLGGYAASGGDGRAVKSSRKRVVRVRDLDGAASGVVGWSFDAVGEAGSGTMSVRDRFYLTARIIRCVDAGGAFGIADKLLRGWAAQAIESDLVTAADGAGG